MCCLSRRWRLGELRFDKNGVFVVPSMSARSAVVMAMECVTVTRHIRVGLATAVLAFAVSTWGVSVQFQQGMATTVDVESNEGVMMFNNTSTETMATDKPTFTHSSLLAPSPPTDADGVTAVAPGMRSPARHADHIESFSRCQSSRNLAATISLSIALRLYGLVMSTASY